MTAVGVHCICELYGCDPDIIDDHGAIQRILREAANIAGATWIGEVSHRFTPCGVTALGLLSESHISVHTWPEVGYVAADCFTCGDIAIPEKACRYLGEALGAERVTITSIPRAMALRPAEVAGVDPHDAHMSVHAHHHVEQFTKGTTDPVSVFPVTEGDVEAVTGG